MSHPAFVTPIPISHSTQNVSLRSNQPRMSVSVPRPTGQRTADAFYKRVQERREGYFGPSYTSDLLDQAEATPSMYAQFAITNLLGNAHVFESELESLVPIVTRYETTLDARELVREVAKSAPFRERFFESSSNTRFVELCYKFLLGRAPSSQAEVAATCAVLFEKGYDGAIDYIVDSEEYAERFGNVLLPFMSLSGDYMGGMPGFCAQMKLQLPTRGGTTDAICKTARTTNVLAGNNPAGVFEIEVAYRVSIPKYDEDWMELPRSTLLQDWASYSLIPVEAAEKWASNRFPRATGEAEGAWKPGWTPKVVAENAWSTGWNVRTLKRYV